MLPRSVAVLQCHLGWLTLLKCNKNIHAFLPACQCLCEHLIHGALHTCERVHGISLYSSPCNDASPIRNHVQNKSFLRISKAMIFSSHTGVTLLSSQNTLQELSLLVKAYKNDTFLSKSTTIKLFFQFLQE